MVQAEEHEGESTVPMQNFTNKIIQTGTDRQKVHSHTLWDGDQANTD